MVNLLIVHKRKNIFFFSSRRRHTRFSRDWSSDVCSSDLVAVALGILVMAVGARSESLSPWLPASKLPSLLFGFFTFIPVCFALEEVVFRGLLRSEERRVGEE